MRVLCPRDVPPSCWHGRGQLRPVTPSAQEATTPATLPPNLRRRRRHSKHLGTCALHQEHPFWDSNQPPQVPGLRCVIQVGETFLVPSCGSIPKRKEQQRQKYSKGPGHVVPQRTRHERGRTTASWIPILKIPQTVFLEHSTARVNLEGE